MPEVVALAGRVGVKGLELWAQPPHVDYPLSAERLSEDAELCREAGVEIPAVGSYFTAGAEESFGGVIVTAENQVEIALAFGASTIRIWAGEVSFSLTTRNERENIYREIRNFADYAAERDIVTVLERHHGSLTDDWDAPEKVIEEVAHPAVFLNYQVPHPVDPDEYSIKSPDDFRSLLSVSRHAHLQNYVVDSTGEMKRSLLDHGLIDYSAFGRLAAEIGYDGWSMVEFCADERAGLSHEQAMAHDVAYLSAL